MTLADYAQLLRRRGWVLLAGLVLGTSVAVALSAASPPVYIVRATVLVSAHGDGGSEDLESGSEFAEQRAFTYAAMADSGAVLAEASRAIGVDPSTLDGLVRASRRTGTSLIDIVVEGRDGQEAAAAANAVADTLALMATATEGTSPASTLLVQMVVPAAAPTSPTFPRTKNNAVIGAVLGGAAGATLLVLDGTLDSRVRRVTDLPREARTGLSVSLRQGRRPRPGRRQRPDERLEDLRFLRAALDARGAGGVLAVIGAGSTADARGVAGELARVTAETGSSVLVIDADPWRENTPGGTWAATGSPDLGDLMAGVADLDDVVGRRGGGGVSRMSAGAPGEDSGQLLSRRSAPGLLRGLAGRFDRTFIACGAVPDQSEGLVAAALARRALVVVERGRTTPREVADVMAALRGVGIDDVTVVLDGASYPATDPAKGGASGPRHPATDR